MVAGHKVGTIFAEVDLDFTPYTRAQKKLVEDAKSTTINIEKNYKDLGIKSAKEFDLMRAKIKNAYVRIAGDSKTSAEELIRVEKAKNAQLRKINDEQFGRQKKQFEQHTGLIQTLKNNWLAATAAIYAAWRLVGKGMDIASGIFEAGKVAAQTKLAFTEIAGSAKLAEEELAFLRTTADKLGQNFWALTDSYKGVLAASKTTNIAGQQTRDIFEAVMKASTTLGLSMDRTKLALYAVEQMMSKGKVSSEELRRQLGDVLPGAFSLAAKAMGMTTSEFDKMLRQGKIMSDDFLPKFAKALNESYSGTVTEAVAATNKWDEAWMDLKVTIAGSGFLETASETLRHITSIIKDPNFQQSLSDFARNMGVIVEKMASLAQYAGLRSVTSTFFEGISLAKQGAIDLEKFTSASFTERQRMVDNAKLFQNLELKSSHGIVETPSSGATPPPPPPPPPPPGSKYGTEEEQKLIEKIALSKAKNADLTKESLMLESKYHSSGAKGYAEHLKAMGEYNKNRNKESKLTAEQAKAEIDLQKMLVDSLKRTDKGYFEYKWQALKDEKQRYIDLGFSKTQVEEAFAKKAEELYREQTLAHGNMIEGMMVGLQMYLENQKTWADQGLALFNTFTNAMTSSLSDSFYAVIKGTGGLDDIWKSFLDTMLKAFTDMLAEMVVQWAMSGLMDLIAGKGFSGFSVSNLLGGTAVGEALGVGGTGVAVAGATGAGSAAVAGGAAAAGGGYWASTGMVAGFEPFTVGGAAEVTGATTGLGTTLGVGAAILAAPVLGPTITSAGKSLLNSIGIGGVTGPNASMFLDAMLAGLDYVPGWENETKGFLSHLLSVGRAEEFMLSKLKSAGYLFDPIAAQQDDPYGTFTPAFTDPTAGKYTDLLEMYKGLKAGIDFVPADGPYYLHRGERVTSAENNKGQTLTVNIPIYIDGKQIGYVVAEQFGTNPELVEAARKVTRGVTH